MIHKETHKITHKETHKITHKETHKMGFILGWLNKFIFLNIFLKYLFRLNF